MIQGEKSQTEPYEDTELKRQAFKLEEAKVARIHREEYQRKGKYCSEKEHLNTSVDSPWVFDWGFGLLKLFEEKLEAKERIGRTIPRAQ